MNKDLLLGINISLDVYSICICIVIIISLVFRKRKNSDPCNKYFIITCLIDIFFSIADIVNWISDGDTTTWKKVALPLSNFLYYYFGLGIFLFYLKYIKEYYSKFSKVSKIYLIIAITISSFYLVLLILTPSLGLAYTISPENVYSRGKYFNIIVFTEIIFYVEITMIVLQNMKKVPGHQTIAFSSFIVIPFVCWLVQLFNYGISLNGVGLTFSFFIIFINMNRRLEESMDKVNEELKIKNKTIITMQDNTIISLSNLVENRDSDTGHHVRRTRDYVTLIARQCQKDNIYSEVINDIYITLLTKSAPLHDIGKIIVPDYVLKKPGKLNQEEFSLMQTHAKEGGRIINEVLGIGVDPEYLRVATEIATAHHERWDGKGYPYKLSRNNIPLSARIMAIADVFDALVSKRCYKESMSIDSAFNIILDESGSHFDPILVEEFIKVKNDIIHIVNKFVD